MEPDKDDIERRINAIKARTPDALKAQWQFEPYYDSDKDVIVHPTSKLKKDGTLQTGRLHQIVGYHAAKEVRGYRRAAVEGMLKGSQAGNRREAYSMIVEKQTERALADDGNVQAAVFVAKAIGAFQKLEVEKEQTSGIQINLSPEIARDILDRMQSKVQDARRSD